MFLFVFLVKQETDYPSESRYLERTLFRGAEYHSVDFRLFQLYPGIRISNRFFYGCFAPVVLLVKRTAYRPFDPFAFIPLLCCSFKPDLPDHEPDPGFLHRFPHTHLCKETRN
ncbi:hypothetical protein D3C86_1289470 [compost metagenome]